MGFLDKKDSQWDRVNKNIDNENGFFRKLGEEGEGKRRFGFLGWRERE